jgi:hypothetical protein
MASKNNMVQLVQIEHIQDHDPATCAECGETERGVFGFVFRQGEDGPRVCTGCAVVLGFTCDPELLIRVLAAHYRRPRHQ